MKILYLFFCLTIGLNSFSQNDFILYKNLETNRIETANSLNSPELPDEQLSPDLVYDCSTVFWTVNGSGQIRQWDLVGNQVTGGAIVQTGSGASLAFCGPNNDLTFYSSNGSSNIFKYDVSTASWIQIPSTIFSLNFGGYKEHLYSLSDGNSTLNYYDGNDFIPVPGSFISSSYQVADIAVDSLGRAWVFTGSASFTIDTVKVFDRNGFVASYAFNSPINANGCYGSFFINDQLYVGRNDNILFPININGTSASQGTSIPFINYAYTDFASCNKAPDLDNSDSTLNHSVTIYPNPASNQLNIITKENITDLFVYSIDGKLIKAFHNTKSVDISDLVNSTYLIKIISENTVYNKFIVKR